MFLFLPCTTVFHPRACSTGWLWHLSTYKLQEAINKCFFFICWIKKTFAIFTWSGGIGFWVVSSCNQNKRVQKLEYGFIINKWFDCVQPAPFHTFFGAVRSHYLAGYCISLEPYLLLTLHGEQCIALKTGQHAWTFNMFSFPSWWRV